MILSDLFKAFAVIGEVSRWAQASLAPDEDGKVRITVGEAVDLVQGMCDVFGWDAEIVLESDDVAEPPDDADSIDRDALITMDPADDMIPD
jgi:hypothetical protein